MTLSRSNVPRLSTKADDPQLAVGASQQAPTLDRVPLAASGGN